jgi:hypothetical protein
MIVLHSLGHMPPAVVDNTGPINMPCGRENAYVPTFSWTYAQSTGPTTPTTLIYQ